MEKKSLSPFLRRWGAQLSEWNVLHLQAGCIYDRQIVTELIDDDQLLIVGSETAVDRMEADIDLIEVQVVQFADSDAVGSAKRNGESSVGSQAKRRRVPCSVTR